MNEDLRSLAADIVARARKHGADEAEAYVRRGIESTVKVRMQSLEELFEAAPHSVTVRVFKDHRAAVCHTSEMTPAALDDLARSAVELASISEPDEYAGLPDKADLAHPGAASALQLYDERVDSLSVDEMKEFALRAEQAAFDADRRINNSEGAGSYPYTIASLSVSVLAQDPAGKMQSDYWYTAERLLHRMEAPEDVGRRAAERVLRKLGPRKVTTRRVPVVFEPTMTASLLGMIAGAATGDAFFKRSTFLADAEDTLVGSPLVNITDDPLLPGRLATRPFDGEGVRQQARPLFEAGVFRQFLFDSYYARRTGRRTTGSASRTSEGVGIGASNLVWQPGEAPPESIISSVKDGLYLTTLMGFGYNQTTGDFSKGAAGIWIEDGRLAYPVDEINVSGNMRHLLADVRAVGDDLQWLGSAATPTILVEGLTVSGL
jgi:PmbA protein